jgi:3-hydroxybutyryl-CoA dehydrogenase
LAADLVEVAGQAGHTVMAYLFAQHGPETSPLAHMSAYLQEIADVVELTVEAVIADRLLKKQTVEALNNAFIGTTEPILTAALNACATEVGGWSVEPQHVIGWAGLPPLDSSQTFEVLPGLLTTPEMLVKAQEFISSLGKEPVTIGDTTGGVLPRVVANLINEAAFALMEDVASADDIDLAMQLGTNYPQGPLAWGDRIGLDQVLGIMTALGEAYGADRYRPAPLLQRLVQAGMWGQRTGRGFYNHA